MYISRRIRKSDVSICTCYELERVFGIKEKTISKKGLHLFLLRCLNKYKPKSLVSLDHSQYNEKLLKHPKRYINGYWQDERYFSSVEENVKDVFQFKGIDEENENLAHEIASCNSVSLHIRRGDYASYGMSLVGQEYYSIAIKYINDNINSPIFYVFSDDKDAAEEIVGALNVKYKFVDINHGEYSYKDMFLMSCCKHNVIANSSFSWWGAWLNSNLNKIVIAPAQWDGKNKSFHPQCESWILL